MSKSKVPVNAPDAPQAAPEPMAVSLPTDAGGGAQAPMQAAPETPRAYTVTWESGLHLRETPSLSGAVLAVLPCGSAVTAAGTAEGGWLPAETDGGRGWVMTRYLKEA